MREREIKSNNRNMPIIVALLLWAIVILIGFAKQFNDTDLYYLIAVGRDVLKNGLSHENNMVNTPGLNYVLQNWLWTVLLAFIYDNFKSAGLFILNLIQVIAMSGCMVLFFKKERKNNNLLLALYLSMMVFIQFQGYANLRPQIITFILLTLEIICIEKYRASLNWRWLILLPFLMLIEINVHASYWIMHYVFILPFVVPDITGGKIKMKDDHIKTKDILPVVISSLSMIPVLFINPYGIENITYVFKTMQSKVFDYISIGEQLPFSFHNYIGVIFIASLIIFVKMLLDGRFTTTEAYAFAGCAILMFLASKWQSIYVIGVMFLMRNVYEKLMDEDKFDITAIKPSIAVISISTLFSLAIIGAIFYDLSEKGIDLSSDTYMNNNSVIRFKSEDLRNICDYLDNNDPKATIYARFEKENYFEFRGYKVYFDARPEIYTKEIAGNGEIIDTITRLYNGMDPDKNYLSESEFEKAVKSVNTDYHVVNPSFNDRYYEYVISHPEKFQYIMGEEDVLYKVLK